MFAATRRLLLLNLGQRRHVVGSIEAVLDNRARLALADLASGPHPPYRSAQQLAEDTLVAAVEAAMAENGGPSWQEAGFRALSEAVGQQVLPLARQAIKVVARVVTEGRELRRRLAPMALRVAALPESSPLRNAFNDIDEQLSSLIGPRFVRLAGARRLADIERYLTAIERRLEKLPANPARDMALTNRVRLVQQKVAEARASSHKMGASPATAQALEDARWMVEELRVSLFAQALGTKGPVSEERVLRYLERALNRAG